MTLVVALVGPTATGKSDLGLALAHALGGEVVNADAMQLYRGMDIGTAKLTPDERQGVPHHLLDVLDVHEDASVADYQARARAALGEIEERGHRAVAVGGSGLYVRALLDHMEFPGTDAEVRARLEARVEAEGARALHAELAAADPVAADGIGPRNARRIVRALEVIEITGRPYSASLPQHVYEVPAVQIGLDCDRAVLDARITERVERMWSRGLVDEVERLRAHGLGRTASRAVGYAEVLAMLARRAHAGRGAGRGRRRHPSARAQADGLVRPGPAGALARRAGPGPRRARARRSSPPPTPVTWGSPRTTRRHDVAWAHDRGGRPDAARDQGSRHAERLRAARRPRRARRPVGRPGPRARRPARRRRRRRRHPGRRQRARCPRASPRWPTTRRARWFMDYRNADGSVAEMCGNGVRVFAAYLERLGLWDAADGELALGTRAGVRRVRRVPVPAGVGDDVWYAVDMGRWHLPGGPQAVRDGADAEVVVAGLEVARAGTERRRRQPARGPRARRRGRAGRGRPHAGAPGHARCRRTARTSSSSSRSASTRRPTGRWSAGSGCACTSGASGRPGPAGRVRAPRRWRSARGPGAGAPDVWLVDVPGGTVRVSVLPDGHVELAGPAVLVAAADVDLAALAAGR